MTRPDPAQHRDKIQHFAAVLRNIIDLIPGGGDTAHMRADAQASVAVAEEQALAALEESVK